MHTNNIKLRWLAYHPSVRSQMEWKGPGLGIGVIIPWSIYSQMLRTFSQAIDLILSGQCR